eukprot:EG_transcript_43284
MGSKPFRMDSVSREPLNFPRAAGDDSADPQYPVPAALFQTRQSEAIVVWMATLHTDELDSPSALEKGRAPSSWVEVLQAGAVTPKAKKRVKVLHFKKRPDPNAVRPFGDPANGPVLAVAC